MVKKRAPQSAPEADVSDTLLQPLVAAALTGVVYQAKLLNRQSKLNIPEQEVISEVVSLWHTLMDALGQGRD